MPFEIGETINKITDSFLTIPMVKSMATNPIYTALAIIFIVMLITMFVFRDVESDESLLVLCLRSGFWIFMFTVGIMLVHNKVLTQDYRYETKIAAYDDVFEGAYVRSSLVKGGNDLLEDFIVPVNINTDFSSFN